MNNLYYKHCTKCNNGGCVFRGSADTHELCEDFTEWIPVSERLPNTMGVYIVSKLVRNEAKLCNEIIIVDACFFDGTDTWFNDNRVNHDRKIANKKIIAWMPLPEPYVTDTNVGKKAESGE